MLEALGLLPWVLSLLLLAAAGAALSWRQTVWRLFIVLGVVGGHFTTYLMTRRPPPGMIENPSMWSLITGGVQLFLPLAMPALGSMLALKFEQRQAARDEPELTEESLLAEKIPQAPPELSYDLQDVD